MFIKTVWFSKKVKSVEGCEEEERVVRERSTHGGKTPPRPPERGKHGDVMWNKTPSACVCCLPPSRPFFINNSPVLLVCPSLALTSLSPQTCTTPTPPPSPTTLPMLSVSDQSAPSSRYHLFVWIGRYQWQALRSTPNRSSLVPDELNCCYIFVDCCFINWQR